MTEYPGFYRVKYAIKESQEVSVVIVKETKNTIPKDTLIKIADDYGRDRVEFCVVDGNYKGDIELMESQSILYHGKRNVIIRRC